MAGWRRVVELAMTCEEIERLTALSRSRTEPASRVSRAQMLLAYRENPSFCAVGQRVGVHHQTVQRCVERALGYGPLAAIEDRPRPGKEPVITPDAKAWLVSATDSQAEAAAHRAVDEVKRALGERGPVWWDDGSPDLNRHIAKNTPYADWFARLARCDHGGL